jgi:hypothetical protein
MITRFARAGSILALTIALAAPAFGYDILLNTDFSDGTEHWKDDPNATSCLNAQATSSGVMIPLSSSWSKLSQTFDTPDPTLELDVTYCLSDDCSFAPNAVFDPSVLKQLTGIDSAQSFSVPLKPGEWIAMIADPQAGTLHYVKLPAGSTNSKSVRALFTRLLEHEEKTFYLIFPPGAGSVTVSHASLEEASQDGN